MGEYQRLRARVRKRVGRRRHLGGVASSILKLESVAAEGSVI